MGRPKGSTNKPLDEEIEATVTEPTAETVEAVVETKEVEAVKKVERKVILTKKNFTLTEISTKPVTYEITNERGQLISSQTDLEVARKMTNRFAR
jgi:hypothetical protein